VTARHDHAERAHQPLERVLGLSQSTAIVVGTVIGSGIFLVPQEMMRAVGRSSFVYLAWLVGGLLSLFGAMTYAELAARMPEAGGEYVYIRRAYGDLLAFLYMWTWFAVAKPASIATVTIGLARTLALFPSLRWLDHPAITTPVPLAWSQLFAIAVTWLMTGLNYIGIRRAANFQLVFTWLKVLLVLVIAITCFASTSGTVANYASIFPGAQGGFGGFMVALIASLWAYDGWNDLNMVAGEVRNPGRNIPLALLFGVGIVGLLYVAVNGAVQYMLPAAAVAASPRPAVAAVSLAIGATGATLVTAGMALSIFVTLNGTVMSGARVPFAAARDGLFFARIAELSPRFRTPGPSLFIQATLSSLLLLAVGRFQQLFELAIFAEWLFYMIAASTIFVHRRRAVQEGATAFRMWGYPLLPVLFIAAAAVLLVYSYQSNLQNSLVGSLIILAGIPLFACFKPKPAR
jgi:APA family basic amino acid/polyamine antiporter